jgi:hypothetical protein
MGFPLMFLPCISFKGGCGSWVFFFGCSKEKRKDVAALRFPPSKLVSGWRIAYGVGVPNAKVNPVAGRGPPVMVTPKAVEKAPALDRPASVTVAEPAATPVSVRMSPV